MVTPVPNYLSPYSQIRNLIRQKDDHQQEIRAQIDTDHNGTIDAEELAVVAAADSNQNGTIKGNELKKLNINPQLEQYYYIRMNSDSEDGFDIVMGLSGQHLSSICLSGADLSGIDFTGANLFSADLSAADLTGAILKDVAALRADFTKANLTGADLSGSDFLGADFYAANLSEANLYGAELANANLNDADVYKATGLYGSQIIWANNLNKLKGVSFLQNPVLATYVTANTGIQEDLRLIVVGVDRALEQAGEILAQSAALDGPEKPMP